MSDNRTELRGKDIQGILKAFSAEMNLWEIDNPEYREYCEGIIRSCISALGNITGEYK